MAADRAVLAVARRRHGVMTVGQLVEAGLSHDAVRHRVKQGWLRRRHRGVYLVGPLETPYSRALAAVLACGDGALLSHRSAAVLWGLVAPPMQAIHVTVGRDVRSRDGIRVHRTTIHPADARTKHGIPVTSPARTLLDLAATVEPARALNEAHVLRLVTDLSLDEQFSRYPRHRGTRALREATRPEPTLTRSEAERRALELIRRARLPEPATNVKVSGYEVDLLWRAERLIVEVDGYAFHSMRRSFEHDRRRDADLITSGYTVMRVTWRQIEREPEATAATLATALSLRS